MSYQISDFIFGLSLSLIAGLSTGIGSFIALFSKSEKTSHLAFFMGFSSGVMVYISFVELLGKSIQNIGFNLANVGFFAGIFIMYALDLSLPHLYIVEDTRKGSLLKTGVLVAIGIGLHNFPEGLVVVMSALSNVQNAVAITFAIALHNIPEGISVSVPIFYATKSKKKAFMYSFLSGICEPIGAFVGLLILFPFLTMKIVNFTLALVAGFMVYISFDELLPLAHKYGKEHTVIFGFVTGMIIMAISLALL
jgi:ZIP family zinc transporter